jgi:Right handed beta helix region
MSEACLLSSYEGARMKIPRWSTDTGVVWLVAGALLGLLGLARPTHAAEFACGAGDVACLMSAINAANVNGTANTITLAAGLYTLTAVDHNTNGPTGLPSVTSLLTLRGSGVASTVIERAAGAPQFRLLHVAATGRLTLEGLTLRGGDDATTNGGGGVHNRGTLTITHSTLSGNTASSGGGGAIVNIGGTLTITHSTLRDNTAGTGGAIDNQGIVTITDSTLSDNKVSGSGGGISIGIFSFLTIRNSTLHSNMANSGGGISMFRSGLWITNSTISGNTANSGGGILNGGPSSPSLQNTILARNIVPPTGTGPDCWGFGSSQGHNLLGDPTGCIIALLPTDVTGDPGLGDFTDDGTPGQGYLPLLPESPAIDAGDSAACPTTDQLGQLRVTPCDIGAIEFASVTVTLGLNQAAFRAGDTLRVRLGIHNPGPTITADAYLGILLPDGVTVLFVTCLAPLDGVVTRLDADPRTFVPLAASYDFPSGEEATVEDFFVYTVTGGESPGSYTVFSLLTPPGAFADGQVDAGDLLGLTVQLFTVSP